MNEAIRIRIQGIMTNGTVDPAEIVDVLLSEGYDRLEVVQELGAMVGSEVHPENRWRPPSPEDLQAIRRLREGLDKGQDHESTL